ncbi:MAG: response regulator [Elusimicrobiota bacterium]|jgi:CheY-like chemotaxis protein
MNSQPPRILFIEDQMDLRQIYKDVFKREGFSIQLAEDGLSGLAMAQAAKPDLILLDLMLPKMSGLSLLEKLRASEETRDIPVVVFSAAADTDLMQKAFQLGAKECLTKALNPPKYIVQRVRDVLERVAAVAKPAPADQPLFIRVDPSTPEGAALFSKAGLSSGAPCPACQAPIAVELLPDQTRSDGHWFFAHLICSSCRKSF